MPQFVLLFQGRSLHSLTLPRTPLVGEHLLANRMLLRVNEVECTDTFGTDFTEIRIHCQLAITLSQSRRPGYFRFQPLHGNMGILY